MPTDTNATELRDILQVGQIDVGNETLFSKRDKLRVSTDHLTLVISSGGSGAAAIREAVRTAKQKLVSDYSTYMKFIMIDSDSREVNTTTNQVGQAGIEVLNISTRGASDRLRENNRTDFFKKFVHPKYDVTKLGPNGSARDRVTGKIKFYDNAEGGSTNDVKFRNIIQTIFNTDWSDKTNLRVEVMILAGLSGGNGSGTFEELAVHAREACRRAGATEVRVFGYLFLPDTVEAFEKENLEALKSIYINGYSALKELESYMSIPASPGRSEEFYSRDGAITIECNDANRLFDYPILISGTYEESKSMMAESIINLAIESDGPFDQNSFYSNGPVYRTTYLAGDNLTVGGVLRNDVFPEDSRRYCGIGYAYAAIPDQIVTANVVSNVCQKLYQSPEEIQADGVALHFCTEENRMSRFEMETQIRKLFGFKDSDELNERSLWNLKLKGALERYSLLPDNHVDITQRDVETGNTNAYESGFRATECVNNGTQELIGYLADLVTFFKDKAKEVIRDYGPKAMELLFRGDGPYNQDGVPESYPEISIENMLNTAKAELQKVITTTVARPELTRRFLESIRRAGLTQWRGDFQQAIQYEVKRGIAQYILAPNGAWERNLTGPINSFVNDCKRFAESLEVLSNFYKSAGSSLDAQSYEQFRDASQKGNCVNLCNNENVYEWIQQNIRRKINGINMDEVKQNMVNSFVQNTGDWVSDAEGKTRKMFDEVMARSCELGSGAGGATAITLTATSYFDYVLEQEPQENVANKARELVQGIVRQLIEKSRPALKTVPGSWNKVNSFILLPQALDGSSFANPIKQAFRDELARIGGNNSNEPAVSSAVSDIVCYQTSVANALCDLVDIGKWENYYNSAQEPLCVSRHLCNGEDNYITKYTERTKSEIETDKARKEGEPAPNLLLTEEEQMLFGTGLSWEHYPPIALRNMEKNDKEKEFLRTMFNPIVEYAMKEKLIERKISQAANRDIYEYVVHLIPNDWKNLNVEDYEEIGLDGRFERGEKLFNYLKQQNPVSTKVNQKSIILFDSGMFAQPFDFSTARQSGMNSDQIEAQSIIYMKRILRKNTELFLELRETLCRYYEIVTTLEAREEDQKYGYQVEKFIRYYQYGIVIYSEKDAAWRYMVNNEGRMKTLCRFDRMAETNYTPIEKKLAQMDWEILMAFKKFTDLNFDELERIAREKEISGDRNEMNTLLEKKREELRNLVKKLEIDFIDPAGEDREPEDAIRFCLRRIRNGNADDEFYVKTLANMYESLKELEPVPVKGWDCPECGRHNDEDFTICPKCGRKRQVPVKGWDCPKCGRHNDEEFMICPKCGTAKREEPVKGWDCPECGRHNDADFMVCPRCGTSKPEKQDEIRDWSCPKCGRHNDADFMICPKCGTSKPEEQDEIQDWSCPKCGRHNDADFMICPKCGTERN